MYRSFFSVLLAILLAPLAQADVVMMKNGDRLSGTVDSIAGGRLLLQTEYAGLVPLNLDAIAQVETEGELDLRVGREQFSGTLAPGGEGKVTVGEQTIALTDISAATENNIALGGFGSEWSSNADIGLIISNGNSKTQSINTLIESVLKRERSQHNWSLLISQEEAEEQTTKDQTDFDYGYKRFMNERWYFAGNFEYFQDDLKDIDQRLTLGAGAGYQFWDNSLGAFSTELGISAVREETTTDSQSDPALRWALDYNRYLWAKKLEFFHKQSILFIPDSDQGEVLDASTGLRFAVSDRISTTARVDVIHETEPVPGNSKTDVTYTVGIGVKF